MRQMEELISISQTLEFDKLKVGSAQGTLFSVGVGGVMTVASRSPHGPDEAMAS